MKFIKGDIDVRLSLEDVNTINDLIRRDTAKPVRKSEWEYKGKKYINLHCPSCDAVVSEGVVFCRTCGQRLDMENIALEGGE